MRNGFTGGKDYTALESRKTHADIYKAADIQERSMTPINPEQKHYARYEAARKLALCGWRLCR